MVPEAKRLLALRGELKAGSMSSEVRLVRRGHENFCSTEQKLFLTNSPFIKLQIFASHPFYFINFNITDLQQEIARLLLELLFLADC